MHSHFTRTWRTKIAAGASAAVLSAFALIASVQAADPNTAFDAIKTATPIKHVIIIVGENRSFDHLFATYLPRHEEEGILNLLSENIITAAGAPGRHFARAHQYQISSAPNGGKFFSSADLKNKTLYSALPPPDVGPRPRFSSRWTKAAGITTRDSSSRLISSAPARAFR